MASRLSFISLAVFGALLAPSAAMADSIVYIDQGNVWSASPDGARKVQLTDGGNWHSPTQADDGTIAAVQGTGPIQIMARDGQPLRTIVTAPQHSSNGGTFAPRPIQLSFSPDGSKLAYAYIAFSCPPASTCNSPYSTFYTRADVTEATPVEVYGNQYNVWNPEWITNDRTLVFGGAGSQVSIDDLGPGDYSHTAWLTPNADQGDGELSRDGKKLATTFFYGDDTQIAFFAVSGDARTQTPPAQPQLACNTDAGDPKHADPSWSPDSSGVAFGSSAGIEVYRFTGFGPDFCELSPGTVLTATGTDPDWGPADPPAARYAPATAPAPAPETTPAPVATPVPTAGPGRPVAKPGIAIATSKATRAALRRGLSVKVTVPAAGRVTVKLRSGARTVATGKATAKRAGAVTVRLSKVKSVRGKKLTLAVTAGGLTGNRTIAVR